MRKLMPAVLCCLTPFAHTAPLPDSIDKIPMSDCNIKTVGVTALVHNVKRRGDLSDQAIKTLEVMKKAATSAKKPGIAIGEQMSAAENDAYSTALQYKMSIDGMQLIESDYFRDIKAIQALVQVADVSYRYDTQLKPSDPNYVYQGVLGLMDVALPEQKTSAPNLLHVCTVEIAVHSVEDESLQRFDAMKLSQVYAQVEAILDRNHIENFDQSKVSNADAEQYKTIMQKSIYPAQRELKFIQDPEYIKQISLMNDLIYELAKKDMADSRGNYMMVGTSLGKMARDKQINNTQAIAYSMRDIIANQVPSEALIQMRATSKYIDEANKKHPLIKKKAS